MSSHRTQPELESEADRDVGSAGRPQEVEDEDLSDASIDAALDEGETVFRYPPGYDVQALAPTRDLSEKEKILVAHFDGLSESMKNAAMVSISQLNMTFDKAKKWMKKHRPPIKMVDCRSLIDEVQYNEFWTEADEEKLLDDWEDDPLAAQLEELDTRKNRDILPMWKVIRRFLGCFPTDIISHRNYLKYHLTFETEGGVQIENPNWTKTFCRRLARLSLHGLFQLDPNLLTLALQYVVVCRTDYRGPIPWSNHGTDRFLDLFLFKMQEQDGSKSVVRIHREVIAYYTNERKFPTSYMSNLFRCIEKRAFRRRQGEAQRDEVRVFEITTEDLATLTKAVDAIRSAGVPAFLSLPITYRIVNHAKQSNDAPKDLENLNELRTSLILRDKRHEIVDQRRRATRSGHVSPANSHASSAVRDQGRKRTRQADEGDDSESGLNSEANKRRRRDAAPEVLGQSCGEELEVVTLKARLPNILARVGFELNLSREEQATMVAIFEDELSPQNFTASAQAAAGSPTGAALSMGDADNYSDLGPIFQDSSPRRSDKSTSTVAGDDTAGEFAAGVDDDAAPIAPFSAMRELPWLNRPFPESTSPVPKQPLLRTGKLGTDAETGTSWGKKPLTLRAPAYAPGMLIRREPSPEIQLASSREVSGRATRRRTAALVPLPHMAVPPRLQSSQAFERLIQSYGVWMVGRQTDEHVYR
ncbi:hypothetical protein F5Y13DRAFT_169840 [Hypoxylon sp. FL1857]|nr:hypothetical protein F5Y13DRAFT_169840 [Hypoxylon sp. FL1857]